jgi:hypothetical protein
VPACLACPASCLISPDCRVRCMRQFRSASPRCCRHFLAGVPGWPIGGSCRLAVRPERVLQAFSVARRVIPSLALRAWMGHHARCCWPTAACFSDSVPDWAALKIDRTRHNGRFKFRKLQNPSPFFGAQRLFHLLALHACSGSRPEKRGRNDRSATQGRARFASYARVRSRRSSRTGVTTRCPWSHSQRNSACGPTHPGTGFLSSVPLNRQELSSSDFHDR